MSDQLVWPDAFTKPPRGASLASRLLFCAECWRRDAAAVPEDRRAWRLDRAAYLTALAEGVDV